ncbi:hypothetical protein [Granulicella tundricola]|uniref:Adenylate cyclase n=1 Tax=Granulicella tundricola (strain ATCC BAA-1859 / DSM 23138 / MP5ACTX9) TaxID=1198114 RepID=E8WY80_GRATM|nr:hypothetical protein [Granulicella tundricola]ADW68707.1 hypothetical protein AciX9_1656 [Granulicella tundricola MP5ACTX9]
MKTILEAWSPETQHDRRAIILELDCILASPHFSNSKRYPALLRYIVERALEGRAHLLKERTLGIEVFQRSVDYDTNADTVVRYTAGEVRKRLSLYYHQHDSTHGIHISLPVGSYVPEFLKEHEPETDPGRTGLLLIDEQNSPAVATVATVQSDVVTISPSHGSPRMLWLIVIFVLLASLGVASLWKFGPVSSNAVDQFWGPVRQEPSTALLCVGGNVFDGNHFSGTMTAGKDIQYPFVSMQLASAIARVGGLLERLNTRYQIQASAPTPLGDLRERPVILLGGYNNPWTMRLVETLRFQLPPEPFEGIVDRDHPGRQWTRDKSQPYASTDDYALIARFRDARTGNVVFLLAGLGRNGTEGAAQFATSPLYMEQVSKRIGKKLSSGNLEMVIKVNVIDGKTGAPSIEDLWVW